MSIITATPEITYKVPRRRHPAMQFVATQPLGAASLVFIVMLFLAGVFADFVVPYDPLTLDYEAMLAAPSAEHWLGTDAFGRDVFSRIIFGARTALAVGLLSSFLGSTIGAAIGVASAHFGGRVDLAIQGFMDVLLSFPIIVLALAVVAMLGKRLVGGIDVNLILAIAIPMMPRVERVVRSSALAIREMAYIDAARAAGYGNMRIIFRHMAPNVVAPYLIMFTAFMAQAILLEASLSFLGLGVTEPTAAWGLMLSGTSQEFYSQAPWMIIFPGVAISLAVFSFNLFGDSLRDYLDPRLKV
ncbi:MAG: ABC transporter permease [Xanthobacteraceae bacterium]|nr:ABC transporter permease [Xanthobacteraceae bacterium]